MTSNSKHGSHGLIFVQPFVGTHPPGRYQGNVHPAQDGEQNGWDLVENQLCYIYNRDIPPNIIYARIYIYIYICWIFIFGEWLILVDVD